MTIGKRIFLGYLGVLLLLCLVAGTGLYILRAVEQANDAFIEVDQQLIISAMELHISVLRQSDAFRGFLINGQESMLQPLTTSDEDFQRVSREMQDLVRSEEGRRLLEEIVALEAQWGREQDVAIGLHRQGQTEEAIRATETTVMPLREQLREKVPPFVDFEERVIAENRDALAREVSVFRFGMVGLSLLAIALGLAAAWTFTRSITRQLHEAIGQLATSTSEISAMSAQVASGAAETATAVSETTSTVEEVKQTAHIATQKAKTVSDTAKRASETAQSGRRAVEEITQGMHLVREQVESTARSVVKMSEQGQAIGEIIATVDGLAEQSNLLAVNAAIEAARAGEQGKGFSVVAQEVRNLAEQSKRATAQVRRILGDIQKATGAAVMATEQGSKAVETGVRQAANAGEAIAQLAASLDEAAQAAAQIAASSQQQLAGMDQVAIAMENINQASAQNVAGTKQTGEAANALRDLAGRMKGLIEATPDGSGHVGR